VRLKISISFWILTTFCEHLDSNPRLLRHGNLAILMNCQYANFSDTKGKLADMFEI
jgi:hypothetical protein